MKHISIETTYLHIQIHKRDANRAVGSEEYFASITSKYSSPIITIYLEESDILLLNKLLAAAKEL